ncbi:MAG: pantoate--beta-alanine ligase [Balneolaceae bacterium]
MLVTGSIDEIRSTVRLWKRERLTVGLVPTMGALHEGHLHLIRQLREEVDRVVVSIFVNPTQFGPGEDYTSYPRTLDDDLKKCRKLRTAAVFHPDSSDMYPADPRLSIDIRDLNEHLCGASRPGFFEGVVLIVNKLFNIVEPDLAIFGQKDFQQYQIISRMVREFNHPVRLRMGEIVRANDGLALSSRNSYLSNQERLVAPSLYRSLRYISLQIEQGVSDPALLLEHQKRELEGKGFKIDYFGIYSVDELHPVDTMEPGRNYLLAAAVYLGKTRLIDNMILSSKS